MISKAIIAGFVAVSLARTMLTIGGFMDTTYHPVHQVDIVRDK